MQQFLTTAIAILVAGLGQPALPAAVETPHLTLTASTNDAEISPGARVSLFVDISPKPKMHVYAPGEKDGIPVALTLEPNPAFTAAAPEFPPPQKYHFEPLKLTQLVFSKPFRITQKVTLAGSRPEARKLRSAEAPKAGSTDARELGRSEVLTIKGTLRYQACDDTVCYLPKSIPVSWTLKIR
jgi:hypothetical protein